MRANSISLDEVFGRQQLFSLPYDKTRLLLSEGSLELSEGDIPSRRGQERGLKDHDLCLIWCHSLDDDFDFVEPFSPMVNFCKKCYVASCTQLDKPVLSLTNPSTLYEHIAMLVPDLADDVVLWDTGTSGHASAAVLQGSTSDQGVHMVKSTSFQGKYRVCSCGDEGCGTDFAWIDKGRMVLHAETVGFSLRKVRICPVAEGNNAGRIRAAGLVRTALQKEIGLVLECPGSLIQLL